MFISANLKCFCESLQIAVVPLKMKLCQITRLIHLFISSVQ